ncbi:hypothetical protein U1Q18_008013 [Sarracenia purpurea var. burkii]
MDCTSIGAGFMAVFAVSGSVVLLAHQVHKRFLSDFMKKIEFELVKSHKDHPKKKVRFADDVVEPSSDNKRYRRKHSWKAAVAAACGGNRTPNPSQAKDMEIGTMPLNRQALYKGIIKYKTFKGRNISN